MNKTTTPSIAPEKVKNEKTRHLSLSGHLLQCGIRIWLLALILFTGLTNARAQSLVAGWDFQTTTTGGTATAVSPATPKVYFSNFGSGFLFFDGSNGSSNWFVPGSGSTSTELNAFGGTAINAGAGFSTVTSGASSLALVGGAAQAANGKRAVFSFSMVNYYNLVVSYATQRTSTGFTDQLWEYSTDGVNWFLAENVNTLPANFGVKTLAPISGLNGAATAYLRLTVTGATSSTSNNRLDNIQLNASVGVPLQTGVVSGSPFCISNDAGMPVSVPFSFGGTINPANVYTAQLSSDTGSFAAPVNIGTLASTAATGVVSALIPAGTLSGSGYRIRIVSSDPAATGSDNGSDLVIDKVVASASSNGPVCAGLSLQLNAAGGVSYSWTGPNTFSSPAQNPLIGTTTTADSGVYLVTVSSALGCTDTASTLAVVQTCACIPPALSASFQQPSCTGGTNGSIDLSVSGGVSPYTFLWSTGALTEDISGVSAGTYSVIVTDAISCVDTLFVSVSDPAQITSSVLVSAPGCQGFSNGSIDLSVSGGTPGYTYLWDNGATSEDISGLAAGVYSVTITDANGCTSNNFGVVPNPGIFTLSSAVVDVNCAGSNNGAVNITASNDTLNTTNPGLLISEFLANPAGVDSSKEWVELVATRFIDFSLTPYTVIFSNNGNATTKGWVQGGVASATTNGTYAFEINSGTVVPGDVVYVGGNAMAVNGTKIRVKDVSTLPGDGGIGSSTTGGILGNGGPNADGIGLFNLPVAALDSNTAPVDAIFFGTGTGGTVVAGGTAGFTLPTNDRYTGGFLQSSAFVGPDAGTTGTYIHATGGYNLLTGQYTIRTWAPSSVFTDDTTAIAVISSNSYLWSNGATTEDIGGLAGGTYTVTATSGTGCTASLSVTVNEPAAINLTGTIFDVSCFGGNDGSIDLNVSGGTPPYAFLWNDGDINEDRSLLVSGSYTVSVTDGNSCISTVTFFVDQPLDMSYSTLVTNPSCFGGSDGAIDLSVSGGTAPYTYGWSTGDTTQDISNQPASFYFFNITDANGCTTGGLEFINDPPQIIVSSFSPPSGGTGVQVTITGSGFTGVNQVTFAGIPAASFTVISDNQVNAIVPLGADTGFIALYTNPGCFSLSTDTFFFDPAACIPPALSAVAAPATCFGASDGSIDLSVSGGTPPYTYAWSNGSGSEDIAGLTAGTYTVIVSDISSCPDTLSVTVSEPAAITVSGLAVNPVCNGSGDGSIDVSVNGGVSPYTFIWSNGASTEDLSNLLAGSYTVTVLDANLCAGAASFTLNDPAVLNLTLNATSPLCAGASSGSISPVLTGGVIPYTYSWSNGATSAGLTNVPAGIYTLIVTDSAGCSVTASAALNDPAPFTLTVNATTDVDCYGTSTGAIDILASNDPLVPPANPGLLISEFLADPTSADLPFEWVELIATKPIDFSLTPYTVVVANNGAANTKGWRAGGNLTYAFQISAGVVSTGDVFYVGGISMAPTGNKLRLINTATTAGDGFGNANGGGIGNGGTNADAVAVFNLPSAAIDSSIVPVDAVFFGTGLGTAVVNAGLNGYTLPVNDHYNGGLLSAGAFLAPNSASGQHHRASGTFNTGTGTFTSPRVWTLNAAFTDGASGVGITNNNTYTWSNGAVSQDLTNVPAGTYTVTATNAAGCTATASATLVQPNDLVIGGFSPGSGPVGSTVIISGSGFNGADVLNFNGVAATFVIDHDGQITATVPAGAGSGTLEIINTGCDTAVSSGTFTVTVSTATLNLTALLEGYHNGTGGMVPALLNSGVGVSATETDTIRVELRDALSPVTVIGSGTAVISTGGQASFSFPASVIGNSYYIAVFHRNAVQTWSALPVTFGASTSYDFTTASTQAYGSNMIAVLPGVYAFYSGDLAPQDEFIDILDQAVIDNDIFNFASGYVISDLNGDGFVDIIDQAIVDNNIFNFIGSVHP